MANNQILQPLHQREKDMDKSHMMCQIRTKYLEIQQTLENYFKIFHLGAEVCVHS